MPAMSINEQAFLAALERWMVNRYRPMQRFNGEFDDAVLLAEARPGINDELAQTLNYLRRGMRGRKKGVDVVLRNLAQRGLLKRIGTGWYDIVDGVLD